MNFKINRTKNVLTIIVTADENDPDDLLWFNDISNDLKNQILSHQRYSEDDPEGSEDE